jgi:hypothetical protein
MGADVYEEGESIVLVPSLEECVITKAEGALRETLQELLTGQQDQDERLQRRYETLRVFLEEFKCERLRGAYEPLLLQGQRVRFFLRLQDNELLVTL